MFCLHIAFDARAQYRFDHWTADTGLPQNSVKDILQTRDGYLWLTTSDGLVRFDGVRFTVFNKGNSPGISSNRFLMLHEDAQGDLWAGTEDGGVVRYHQGRFNSYGSEHGLTSLHVLYFRVDGVDSNEGLSVYLFDGQKMRLSSDRFLPIGPATDSATSGHVKPQESRRVPCAVDRTQISCYGYGSKNIWTKADGLPSLNLAGVNAVEDKNGVLWIGLRDVGLIRIEKGKIVKIYTENDGLPGRPVLLIAGNRTGVLTQDKQGAFWWTHVETWQHQFFAAQFPILSTDSGADTAYEDREGNLWFNTSREGLYRARRQSITTYSKADGLAQNNVYPIYEDRNGVVWIGTTDGIYSYRKGTVTVEESLSPGIINSIFEDKAGRIIVGKSREVWVQDGERFVLDREMPGAIWAIYPDHDGALWFGLENGLVRLKDGVETRFTTKDGLAGDDVKVIIEDGAGGFWIGSYGGLTHYKDGKFKSWTESDGLPSRTIRSLYRDGDGVLWIGTYDGGLGRFKGGKFTRYTTRDGLYNDGVFQILEDAREWFWMSSNRGVYRVSRKELNEFAEGRLTAITSIGYGKSDGMLNVECNGGRWPAGVKSNDGKMWFPTQDGVAVIDPEAVQVNPHPPPVMIESFLLDRNPVAFTGQIEVGPDQENFEVGYTALSFINSENIRFKYKLEGLDRDWVDAGTRRKAYYSHVPPGSYQFRVIAANSDGVWNTEGAVVRVLIQPHFYQTWWFLSLTALSIFGLVVLIFNSRVKRVEKERRAQEEFSRRLMASQEQERQRIAAELHDSLGQSLLIIKNRIALAQSDIDEKGIVEDQLAELSGSAASAIEECREIAYNLRPYQISRFGLSKTLQGIFMRINGVTKIRATAEIEAIDDLLSDEAQINLYRVVQECVNNIIKHSEATEASFAVKREEDEIVVMIRDNGRGFTPNESNAGEAKRGGFGLIGLAERVRMLHGDYKIDTAPGRGTNIRIRLKINNAA